MSADLISQLSMSSAKLGGTFALIEAQKRLRAAGMQDAADVLLFGMDEIRSKALSDLSTEARAA